ncbi:MAG: hypothetical protein ACI9HG_001831, partial [Flavobacteriales bacterium]
SDGAQMYLRDYITVGWDLYRFCSIRLLVIRF